MKKIITDTDDVTAEFTRKFCEFHNAFYVTDLKLEDFTDYNYPKVTRNTREELSKRVEDFYNSRYFLEITPVPGSVEAIKRLSSGYDFSVVTHRPDSLKKKTIDFYDKHFNGLIRDIYFAKGCYNPASLTKVEYISRNGTSYAIEDIFEVGMRIKKKGTPVLILKRPWNEDKQYDDDILQMKDWKAIESLLVNQQIYK